MIYLIILSVFFFISEFILMLLKRSKKTGPKLRRDKGSLMLFWIIIPLCFSIGFTFANYHMWKHINYVIAFFGIIMIISGTLIRWISVVKLNKAFTVDVAITKDHQLITSGIYKYVRHPSYLGLFLIMTGFALGMNSYISFIVITLLLGAAILYRIKVEEKILLSEFGNDYWVYKQKTKKIIPWIF